MTGFPFSGRLVQSAGRRAATFPYFIQPAEPQPWLQVPVPLGTSATVIRASVQASKATPRRLRLPSGFLFFWNKPEPLLVSPKVGSGDLNDDPEKMDLFRYESQSHSEFPPYQSSCSLNPEACL